MPANLDLPSAHRHFAADFFNRVWDLLGKTNRSQEENERMISLCHASLAHWRERVDCTPRNLSVGYWQLSRVYAVVGRADHALHYGALCLAASADEPPFFVGYAHEALARAAMAHSDQAAFVAHIMEARNNARLVADEAERKMLADDLDALESQKS